MSNAFSIVEKLSILLLSAVFLLLFMGKNIMLKKKVGKAIRGKGINSAVILSSLLFTVTNLAVLSGSVYRLLLPIDALTQRWLCLSGYVLFAVSIISGAIVSRQMQDSWRVGIKPDDQTALIQTGVFSVVRNPYFLTYYAMFISFFIIRPAVVLLIAILSTILAYHRMVLREEKHLHRMHGQAYAEYTKRTGRYIPKMS